MNDINEVVKRRDWFPTDTEYSDAIAEVEDQLRTRYDIAEIDSVEAVTTLGDEWKVTVTGVPASAEGGDD